MIPEKFQEFAIKDILYLLEEISNINLISKVFVTVSGHCLFLRGNSLH